MAIEWTTFRGSDSGAIKKSSTSRPQLEGDEVLLKVTASGVCGTDEHYRKDGMVLGHEGVGVVEEVGPRVEDLKAGDRVGWGYQHDSCGRCQKCLTGLEVYCDERKMYGYDQKDQGSFATKAVWKENFLFKLPDNISDEHAAPLMCGGATVFAALDLYDIRPTDRVGIVGIGGLGHLAIQFAAKMGCEVVVFSGSENKREEALKLGATEFYATKDAKELKVGKKIDRLFVTTSTHIPWELYVPVLAAQAVVFPLSIAGGDFSFPYMPLVLQGITVQGSVVSPRGALKRMLDFASFHNIKPVTQHFPLTEEGITDAMQKLNDGNVRYRAVLLP